MPGRRPKKSTKKPENTSPNTEPEVIIRAGVCCPRCGNATPNNFYSTKDPDRKFTGKVVYCKKCIKEIFDNYLKKYKGDYNLAFYYLCRKIDVPYIHKVYQGAVKNIGNEFAKIQGVEGLISAYMKGLSFSGQNGWGSSFDESKGVREIEDLLTYDDTTEVRRDISKSSGANALEDDYEILEYDTGYLQNKWGTFDNPDLAYLENQYLDWEDKLGGIDDKSIDMIVQQICLQALEIRKGRESGADVTKMVKTLRELMNDAGLVEKLNKKAEVMNRSVGQRIEDIERMRPVFKVDPELSDVDNVNKIIIGFTGSLSKTLGKSNYYTQKFDEVYGPYTIDVIEEGKKTIENLDIVEDKDKDEEETDDGVTRIGFNKSSKELDVIPDV